MKLLLTGGGTGGHIYPALAVGNQLQKQGWDILYIGSENGLEVDIVPKNNIELKTISVTPLPRQISIKLFKSILIAFKGFRQALKIINTYQPDIILGTGGFVAGPVMMAAAIKNIPSVIHEQNVYPGITNRLLARFVDRIALNFAATRQHFPRYSAAKQVITGNPIRESILTTGREKAHQMLGLDSEAKTLLVFGGSQGASSINRAMLTVCKQLQGVEWLQIIYITGKEDYERIIAQIKTVQGDNIKIMPYLHRMEWAYAVTDLVVYRAGATGLAEITARGIPAILIPYPHATGDHQRYNAEILKKEGAAEVIPDHKLTGELLTSKVLELLNDRKRLRKMKQESLKLGHPRARDNLITLIYDLVNNGAHNKNREV